MVHSTLWNSLLLSFKAFQPKFNHQSINQGFVPFLPPSCLAMAGRGISLPIDVVDIGLTICSVCGGNEEEDLVLLCDGDGCTNEIHMYCLKPIVTVVPEGDWYCPVCDINGTTLHLENMLRCHEKSFQSGLLKNKDEYLQYLTCLQQKYYPLKMWRPNLLDNRVSSEFNVSSPELVGMPLKVYNEVDDQSHTGRIISCQHDHILDRWLHLVQFRRCVIIIVCTFLPSLRT